MQWISWDSAPIRSLVCCARCILCKPPRGNSELTSSRVSCVFLPTVEFHAIPPSAHVHGAPILHRSHSTPAPTLHKRASSGTGAQIVPLMPSRVKSEKPTDEDDILDYSVWEKEVEALSARVQRLASISRCPELVAVARQHSRKAEQVRVVRTAEPVMVRRRFWHFFHPRRELEDYPDAERKRMKEKKKLVRKQEKEAARARRHLKLPTGLKEWLYGHPSQYREPHKGAFGPGTFSAYDDCC